MGSPRLFHEELIRLCWFDRVSPHAIDATSAQRSICHTRVRCRLGVGWSIGILLTLAPSLATVFRELRSVLAERGGAGGGQFQLSLGGGHRGVTHRCQHIRVDRWGGHLPCLRRWALERGTSMGLGAERWRKRARSARDRSVGCPARSSCPRASLRFPRWAKLGIKIASRARAAAPQRSCGGRLCDVCV